MEREIIKYIRGETTQEESSKVEAWIEESESNLDQFESLLSIWAVGDIIGGYREFDILSGRERVNKRMVTPLRRWFKMAQSVAAILSLPLLLSTALVAYLYVEREGKIESLNRYTPTTVIEAVNGGKIQHTLPDGTVVWLNGRSRVEYPIEFSINERRVVASGELFFDVQPMEEIPMIVSANNLEITVLGTEFNIDTYEDKLETTVSLKEGSVKLNIAGEDNHGTTLTPGDVVTWRGDNIERYRVSTKKIGSWREGLLTFNKATIDVVKKAMERRFDVEVILKETHNFDEFVLTGTFIDSTLESFMASIKVTSPIEYRICKREFDRENNCLKRERVIIEEILEDN